MFQTIALLYQGFNDSPIEASLTSVGFQLGIVLKPRTAPVHLYRH
jgi:hypothetical protein